MNGAQATDNVVADPGYANPAAGDFRLSRSSPCVDVLGGERPEEPRARRPSRSPRISPRVAESACDPAAAVASRRSLVGSEGRDRLIGGPGRDRLAGKRGGDKIVGGNGGPDCLLGGPGSDRLRAVNGSRDLVKCGHGRDRATVEPKDRVRGCERVIARRR